MPSISWRSLSEEFGPEELPQAEVRLQDPWSQRRATKCGASTERALAIHVKVGVLVHLRGMSSAYLRPSL